MELLLITLIVLMMVFNLIKVVSIIRLLIDIKHSKEALRKEVAVWTLAN